MAHTPGPWEATDGKVWRETPGGVEVIAICQGNVEGSPGDNAKLMAGALGLLEALKEGVGAENWDTEAWAAWQSDAQAAIEAAA